jgi:hypothetical protein
VDPFFAPRLLDNFIAGLDFQLAPEFTILQIGI